MAIREVPELASALEKKSTGPSKGCGKGFGGKCNGKGKGKMMGKMMGKTMGGSTPPGPREQISEIATTGDVISWSGSFGWLQPTEPIDHPSASMRGGKIFCHQKDLKGISTGEMLPGTIVQFQVYSDGSGLG